MDAVSRERLVRGCARLESTTQLHAALLPELGRALDASLVFAYRALPDALRVYAPPDTPPLVETYLSEYVGDCPLHALKSEVTGAVVPTTALYGYGRLVRTRVHDELWRPYGLDHHVALRLDDPELGGLGIVINRPHGQGEFEADELRWLQGVVAPLAGALRRVVRIEALEARLGALEALLRASDDPSSAPSATLVFDADGALVHLRAAPEAAAVVLALGDAAHPLRRAARGLVARRADAALAPDHVLDLGPAGRWRGTVSLLEVTQARPLVIITARAIDLRAFGLSRAEQAVLDELVAGRSNAEIGRRLFISPETVRTHLTRIYKKLGVRSRLEAVTKARLRGSA